MTPDQMPWKTTAMSAACLATMPTVDAEMLKAVLFFLASVPAILAWLVQGFRAFTASLALEKKVLDLTEKLDEAVQRCAACESERAELLATVKAINAKLAAGGKP